VKTQIFASIFMLRNSVLRPRVLRPRACSGLAPPPAAAWSMEWRYIVLAAFFLLGLWHRGGREEVQCYIFSVALIFLTVFTFIMEDF